MSPQHFKKFSYLLITILLTLGLSLSLQSLLAAWTAPTLAPPDGNVSAPINESLSDQVKLGGLVLGGNFAVDAGKNICISGGKCLADAVTSELDPQVNTLTNGKWCTTNGTTINCTSDAPSGGVWTRIGNYVILANPTDRVGINVSIPAAQLQVNALSSREGLRIVSASDYSPLNIRNSTDSADIFRVDQTGTLQVGSVPWARMPACAEGQFIRFISGAWACSTIAPTFDFTIDSNPTTGSIGQGSSVQSTITATLQSVASQTVTFSASGLPTGANASFLVPACNPTCVSTMTISTSLTTPIGSYIITITGSGGSVIKTTTYTLQVTAAIIKYVFITSTNYTGNLGGLSGADSKCATRASAVGLSGTWKAWLSDKTTNAADRLTHNSGPYKLLNNSIVAENWNDLIDGTLNNAINIAETGSSLGFGNIWTNTDISGNRINISDAYTCVNWTSSLSSNRARYGVTQTNSYWTNYTYISPPDTACNYDGGKLYCFQQ